MDTIVEAMKRIQTNLYDTNLVTEEVSSLICSQL